MFHQSLTGTIAPYTTENSCKLFFHHFEVDTAHSQRHRHITVYGPNREREKHNKSHIQKSKSISQL